MNAAAHMSTLYPLLPEIVLGLGAMALLMLGAYGDARTARCHRRRWPLRC